MPPSQRPDQTLLDRMRELSIYGGEESMAGYESFKYEWHNQGDGAGYEVFESKLVDGGGLYYAGVFHPDGHCEDNPCRFCGHTVMD
jgi:hypothetical protein